jgi:hypothetical protein
MIAEKLSVPTVPPPPARRASHDPSWVIQRAWSVFRLPRLQELIVAAIAELRYEPRLELAGEQHSVRPSGPDPAAEALRVCCDELREASGMAGADAERAQHVATIHRYMREEPVDWSEAFAHALEAYRTAAAQVVERALARARPV